MDTMVTKEFDKAGLEFSGGQKQKLAIARAFAADREIIIMDEASSALDPIAEKEINTTMLEEAQDKTFVIISHRLSTIRYVDCIYFIQDGQIVESGTHDELMKKNGRYAELYMAQAENYQI